MDVMARKNFTPGVTTSVCLVLDGSSSMNDGVRVGRINARRIDVAAAQAAVLSAALERAGADWCVADFKDASRGEVAMTRLANWNMRAGKDAERQILALGAHGGTPMAQAALWANAEMLGRKTQRRVVIWLIDGQPDGGPTGATKDVISRGWELGIEHVCVGLQCPQVRYYFPSGTAESIQNLSDLPGALLSVLDPTGANRRCAA
jgi:nitric oxide reductase activation protein